MELRLQMDAYLKHVQGLLAKLQPSHQIAFAAWCCERLYPWHEALASFLGTTEHQILRDIIDQLWKHASTPYLSKAQLEALQEQCDALEFGDEGCSILRKGAVEAVGAAWLALEACKHDAPANTAKCGECALNRVDGEIMAQVWELYNRPLGPSDTATVERQISLHPVMQAERKVQSRVLVLLEKSPRLGAAEIKTLIELAR